MAEIRDQLVLDISQALREVDELERSLNRAFAETEVTVDTSGIRSQIENLDADLEGLEATELARDFDSAEEAARRTARATTDITDQVSVTSSEYRQVVRLMEEGEDASRAVAIATGQIADEADQAEDAYRRIAVSLDISEDEARQLTQSIGRSTVESSELDRDLQRVATSMGLSESEARDFAAQTRNAARATEQADRETRNLATSWQRARGFIIAAVAAIGVRGVVDQFNQAVQASANLAESQNAVNVVFGEAARAIFPAAEEAATRFGLSTRALNENATQLGANLLNAGFSADEAASKFLELQERASDTASVLNTDVNEVLVALQAALRGEFDPIERFTGGMNQAAVEAEALSQGLITQGEALDNNARALAVTSLFFERTARFAGDFANTSDSVANQQRTLQGELENTRAELGDALTPVFLTFLDLARDRVVDVRVMSESIDELAGSARDAEGPLLTLGDIIGGIPRGFGVLSDIASLPVSLIQDVGQLGSALLGAEGGAEGIDQAIDGLIGTVDGFFDSLQQRAILESFIQDLREGVDPALAFANAAEATARNNELTLESLEALGRISGASEERLADAAVTMLNFGDTARFTADELAALQIFLGGVSEAASLDELTGADRALIRFATTVEEVGDDSEEAANQLTLLDEGLAALQGVADQTGISIQDVIDNASRFGPEVSDIVSELGAATLETEAFDRALAQLDTSIDLDFSDAVDEFDLLLTSVNDAGDEIPATMEEILTDLQDQADRFARLEVATTILEATGFDSLAAELRSQGPAAAQAAEDFVSDTQSALEAESLLDEGAQLGEEALQGLRDALAQGDITPELLAFAETLTSSTVQQAIRDAAIIDAGIFGTEFEGALARQAIALDIPVRVAAQLAGTATTGIQPATGGTTVINNFNTEPNPTTDTQRITQTTRNLIR